MPPSEPRPLGAQQVAVPLDEGPTNGEQDAGSDGEEILEEESSDASGGDSESSEPGGQDAVSETATEAAVQRVRAEWYAANKVAGPYRGPYLDGHCDVRPGEKRLARLVAEIKAGRAGR